MLEGFDNLLVLILGKIVVSSEYHHKQFLHFKDLQRLIEKICIYSHSIYCSAHSNSALKRKSPSLDRE